MTNETATVAGDAAAVIQTKLTAGVGQGRELCDRIVAWLTDKGLDFAANLVSSAVILILGWLAVRLIVGLVGKAVEKSGKGGSLLATFVRSVTSKVCWAVLLVVVLGNLGVDVGPIVAGLGVTGFILGFAFQESLGNLASGLMIAINEPFRLGDYVIVAGLEGVVSKVDMMATVLVTGDNKKIVIPNKSAWGAPITNFTALGRRRVDLQIAVAYSSDVAEAVRIALETLRLVPNVLPDPEPSVSVAAMGDSAITLNVRPWTDGANYWGVYSDTQVALKRAFERHGIEIPFPQLTIHQS